MAGKRGDFRNRRVEKPSIDLVGLDFSDEDAVRSAFENLATQIQDVSDELERTKTYLKVPSLKRRRD